MPAITEAYARDLDLNLLRVFIVVAEEGSVTKATRRLHVTQPAVSGAIRRLSEFVGAPLFTRQGRGIVLTSRGESLLEAARQHLGPLVQAASTNPAFDPKTSEARVRLGIDEGLISVLVPPLLARLRRTIPRMRISVVGVTCDDVEEAILHPARVDLAVGIVDSPPSTIHQERLVDARDGLDFVCLFDGRRSRLSSRPTEEEYFAAQHVAVSYSGDGRGIVEDTTGRARDIRVSVPGFAAVGEVVDGSRLEVISKTAKRDEDTREGEESFVDARVSLPTIDESSRIGEPSEGALDLPTPRVPA